MVALREEEKRGQRRKVWITEEGIARVDGRGTQSQGSNKMISSTTVTTPLMRKNRGGGENRGLRIRGRDRGS